MPTSHPKARQHVLTIFTALDDIDADGDSTMHSSPDDTDMFPDENISTPSTPKLNLIDELSPPTSLGPPQSNTSVPIMSDAVVPPADRDNSFLNQNGKRVLARGDGKPGAQDAGKSSGAAQFTPQVHQASGYRWDKEEDAPGYSWNGKKAMEEYNRSWDAIVDKSFMIKSECF